MSILAMHNSGGSATSDLVTQAAALTVRLISTSETFKCKKRLRSAEFSRNKVKPHLAGPSMFSGPTHHLLSFPRVTSSHQSKSRAAAPHLEPVTSSVQATGPPHCGAGLYPPWGVFEVKVRRQLCQALRTVSSTQQVLRECE